MTKLTRAALLLSFFFAIDKVFAILRQVIIARQFGLTSPLDAFNVANNLPDMLFALFSSGALALALIPVLSEILTRENRDALWLVFSRIANLVFIATASIALLIAIFAVPLVKHLISPGFSPELQAEVVKIMRLDLIATIIFSVSGMVIAGLQANQHFLFPAMAPIFYNVGQIFGAVILAPTTGYTIGPVTLPAMGLGIYGLVLGVILGAILHLAIQIPGLILTHFHWSKGFGLNDSRVIQILRLMGPRLVTVFFLQLTFIARDNLASHFNTGAVSALTYGWMIQQVPETLIGTAIATALLPTISELVTRSEWLPFQTLIQKAARVLIALCIPVAVILALGLGPMVQVVFHFNLAETTLLMWVTRGFLVGLLGHCLQEIASRSFYARQNAITPMIFSGLNGLLYVLFGILFSRQIGVMGISLGDSFVFSIQAVILMMILSWQLFFREKKKSALVKRWLEILHFDPAGMSTIGRSLLGSLVAGGVVLILMPKLMGSMGSLVGSMTAMVLGMMVVLPFIWKECKSLLRL
jgi:putative peptidoglycan lipid II flippase